MLWFLRIFFGLILASMLGVTVWAGLQCPLFAVPREIYSHPWFIATLFDAYWGFATFFVWVCYKQTSWAARGAWLLAIILLGNIAMAAYCLNELFHPPANGKLAELFIIRRTGPSWLAIALAGAGLVVVGLA